MSSLSMLTSAWTWVVGAIQVVILFALLWSLMIQMHHQFYKVYRRTDFAEIRLADMLR